MLQRPARGVCYYSSCRAVRGLCNRCERLLCRSGDRVGDLQPI